MESSYENMNLFDFLCLIYRKLVVAVKWVFNLFLATIHLCIRYWYVMVLCVVLGFFGARLWLKPMLTRYNGFATVTFAPGMKEHIKDGLISFMTQPGNVKEEEYGIPRETQRVIRKFLMFNVIDAKCDGDADYVDRGMSVDYCDTLNNIMKDRLVFEIDLWGRKDFECFENALTKWFNTQEKFATTDSLYKKALRERLEYVNHEIQRSDSFLDHRYFTDIPQAQQVNVYNAENEGSKSSVLNYEEMLELIAEKERIENILEMNPDVINFKTHFYYETLPPKHKYLISLVVSLVLGLGISLVIKYWANVKKFILTK